MTKLLVCVSVKVGVLLKQLNRSIWHRYVYARVLSKNKGSLKRRSETGYARPMSVSKRVGDNFRYRGKPIANFVVELFGKGTQ